MKKLDLVETWLNTVAYSHSGSEGTKKEYKIAFKCFCDFIEKTHKQILKEYEGNTDRDFKRRYAMYLRSFITTLKKEGYAQGTIRKKVAAVKSFLKYNDLPVGFVPAGKTYVESHNRDMTRPEVIELLKISHPRDRAFYVVMTQSGLRPHTIATLKIKDVEKILDEDTPVPCKVSVPQEKTKGKFMEYFSFIGPEGVQHLKDYLKTRNNLTSESWVFSKLAHEDEAVTGSTITHIFKKSVRQLRAQGIIGYEINVKEIDGKTITRSEIRLYCLRKFFRKFAGMAGADFVNFWMGHMTALGTDLHYISRDAEHHRKIYAEKAMPHLRLETQTPSETEKIIKKQQEEIERLKRERITLAEEIADIRRKVEMLLKERARMT
ncbi:MAG: hypothetical protein OEY88_01645 [Candidatus Bathyarchaeota archaeon]|nr:hypothetical protein [Candidatus Bathyarchaeota archaeon]